MRTFLPFHVHIIQSAQGESNLDSFEGTWAGPRNYACRARAAVLDWRAKFGSPTLPFFFVELAACNNYDGAQYSFPLLRQASRTMLSLPHTGFITAIDVGSGGGVHSPIKVPDGLRLALQLRAKVYSQAVVADGPTLAAAPAATTATGAPAIMLRFRNAAGLHAAAVSGATLGCAQSPFEVGYADGSWARATVAGVNASAGTVVLSLAVGTGSGRLTEVRYAWAGYPQCALYSGEGGWNDTATGSLPAAPFRVAASTGCADTQSSCPVLGGVQCCMNHDVHPNLPGGEICMPHGGGCQCRGCVGSTPPTFPPA